MAFPRTKFLAKRALSPPSRIFANTSSAYGSHLSTFPFLAVIIPGVLKPMRKFANLAGSFKTILRTPFCSTSVRSFTFGKGLLL